MRTVCIGISLILLGFAVTSVSATTVRVDWAGSGDHLTIQEGIEAAGPGDTVLVLPGTYTGAGNCDLDFGGTNLVLVSDGGYTVTTVDCEDAGHGFIFHTCEDTTSVVRGFTITNAAADSGAGAFCWNGSDPRFEYCLFLGNTAQMRGGGLCCVGSSPIIRECRFEENTADEDGASSGYGGGMACLDSSTPLIVDTQFALNQGRYGGGGLYAYYSAFTCDGCDFTGNNVLSFGNEGGGAALSFSDGAVFTGCTFEENGTAVTIVGAGLHVTASDITVTDCTFIGNVAGSSGGAHFTDGSGGTVNGCTFAGNVSTWGACGGISCVFSSNLTITNCTFVDNQRFHICCDESSPTIEYSILAFALVGSPVYCDQGTETPHIHHCFVCANAGGDTLCGGNFHDIVNSDPLFCNRANEEYTLCENSPCLPGGTWPSLVGAHGVGCPPCESATEPTSWGAIKALYK